MITDLFGSTQRFNVPGAAGAANWTARIKEPVHEWNEGHAPLLEQWRKMLATHGRA
jgi:4-alpha-glucanotransferase